MFVSQPLLKESSQLAKPVLQLGWQVPALLQLTVAFATAPQLAPQPPQLLVVRRSVSQLLLSASQSAWSAGQAIAVHLPPEQYGAEAGHLVLQSPQLPGAPRSVSQPSPSRVFAASWLQSPQPASQRVN
jgi:hypothetical protein